MNEPQEAQSTARDHAAHDPCPCREIVDTVREYLGISPAARQHLANSRVEFLKAIREDTRRADRAPVESITEGHKSSSRIGHFERPRTAVP